MNTLALYTIAANAGVMLFFTVAVAPFIFRVLPAASRATYEGKRQRFMVLHTVSIVINFVQLGLLAWYLYETLTVPV